MEPRGDVVRFDALPEPVLLVLFLALPVDARARAACVCRAWRAFLADVSLWQVLDLTPAGGVAAERVTENLARGASARAAGNLRVLNFTHLLNLNTRTLLDAVASGTAALQLVTTNCYLSTTALQGVLAAAPRLQVFNAHALGQCKALLPILRNEPPYGPLRVNRLRVKLHGAADADVLALAAAVCAHESLKGLTVSDVLFARGLNALVDAAAERRVARLTIDRCTLDAESVPALARIFQRNSLEKFSILCDGFPHAEESSVTELYAALRACRTLTRLKLPLRPQHGADHRAITKLLDVAAALPDLIELNLSNSLVQDTIAFGHALGVLLAANPPSLRTLSVCSCQLGDLGLAALLDGLAANTHLRELHCDTNNLSDAFERDRLEPALAELEARANLAA